MKLFIMFAALVALAAAGGVARAERWDSKGWVKLGEREVNGRFDHKFIDFKYRKPVAQRDEPPPLPPASGTSIGYLDAASPSETAPTEPDTGGAGN